MARGRLLMCRPEHYGVDYVINPWMEGNVRRASHELAAAQWQALHDALSEFEKIELIPPQRGLPDMVFTANAGLVAGRKVVPGRFLHKERRGEEEPFREWFADRGFEVVELPGGPFFEGAGDAFWDEERGCLWAAYGERTELGAHPALASALQTEVVSLRLVDPRFYHLDTCFCLLPGGRLLYHPPAFDVESNFRICERIREELRIAAGEDALDFACNAVVLEDRIFLNRAGPSLRRRLEESGLRVIEVPLGEFMKSGGAARCLILDLEPVRPPESACRCAVENQKLKLEGHLLDAGLLDRALEITTAAGGDFRVTRFEPGRRRSSPSVAEVNVSAPSPAQLDKIATRLLDLGGEVIEPDAGEAQLAPVSQEGVAPEDFYATTIFPTEIRMSGRWLRVEDQRMDAVIVADPSNRSACCRLFRNLRMGDRVVTGHRGIRLGNTASGGQERDAAFEFMGSSVSSERRVEAVVERLAWEMRRMRERRDKVIAVAGPVVVHTGGGPHLAWLIRRGYVSALLGGNAIAVHDIEQALFGTSLGIDLARGIPVQGGHRNHLKAINTIRRCGGIRSAVEQGILTSGIMAECVRAGIPFVLAGSIRDDGPLPDTEMNMIRAQREYARSLEGAGMILMLGSMLHSIGVGNMTPAGVKMVCVDINPAVAVKLADRGSLEARRVVTDVGLFLGLLTRHLERGEDDHADRSESTSRPETLLETLPMKSLEPLHTLLKNEGVSFETLSHPPAFTAQELAELEHVKGRNHAKVVVVNLDREKALFVLRSDRMLDLEKVEQATGKQAWLTDEEEFGELFPNCEVGTMPPFGRLYDLPTYVDRQLAGVDEIVFEAGTHTDAIRLSYADFERVAQPTAGDFATGS